MKVISRTAAALALGLAANWALPALADPLSIQDIETGWSEDRALRHLGARGFAPLQTQNANGERVVIVQRSERGVPQDQIALLLSGTPGTGTVTRIRRVSTFNRGVATRADVLAEMRTRFGEPDFSRLGLPNSSDMLFYNGPGSAAGCEAYPTNFIVPQNSLAAPAGFVGRGAPCVAGMGVIVMYEARRGNPVRAMITFVWSEGGVSPQAESIPASVSASDVDLADYAGNWRPIETTDMTERGIGRWATNDPILMTSRLTVRPDTIGLTISPEFTHDTASGVCASPRLEALSGEPAADYDRMLPTTLDGKTLGRPILIKCSNRDWAYGNYSYMWPLSRDRFALSYRDSSVILFQRTAQSSPSGPFLLADAPAPRARERLTSRWHLNTGNRTLGLLLGNHLTWAGFSMGCDDESIQIQSFLGARDYLIRSQHLDLVIDDQVYRLPSERTFYEGDDVYIQQAQIDPASDAYRALVNARSMAVEQEGTRFDLPISGFAEQRAAWLRQCR